MATVGTHVNTTRRGLAAQIAWSKEHHRDVDFLVEKAKELEDRLTTLMSKEIQTACYFGHAVS